MESNSENDSKNKLYAFAIAIIMFLTLVVPLYKYHTYHAEERESHSDKKTENIDKKGEIVCWQPPFVNGFRCNVKPSTADEKEELPYYDLEAQQDMSEWALGVLILTFWMTGITFAGLFYVIRTFNVTRKTLDETVSLGREQIEEARKANEATLASVENAREMGEAQIRAYIRVDLSWVKIQTIGKNSCIIKVAGKETNVGLTPAVSVRNEIEIQICTIDNVDTNKPIASFDVRDEVGQFIGEKDWLITREVNSVNNTVISLIRAQKINPEIVVNLNFTDIFQGVTTSASFYECTFIEEFSNIQQEEFHFQCARTK